MQIQHVFTEEESAQIRHLAERDEIPVDAVLSTAVQMLNDFSKCMAEGISMNVVDVHDMVIAVIHPVIPPQPLKDQDEKSR